MAAFPHAEKFIEVNRILAKDGDIPTLDRATISAFMATLIHEIADKTDALEHFAAENQRLVDAQENALMSLQGGVEAPSKSFACSPSYTMVTQTDDKQDIDDCSPIPRCRQEAVAAVAAREQELARNTDPDGRLQDDGDCSPIPRCSWRWAAAEWAKNTDEYGKPINLKKK